MGWGPPIYTRQDLYDQVWSEPIRDGGQKESLVALARIAAIRATIRCVARLAQWRPSLHLGSPLRQSVVPPIQRPRCTVIAAYGITSAVRTPSSQDADPD